MEEEMQQASVDIAIEAMDKYVRLSSIYLCRVSAKVVWEEQTVEKDIASHIKKEFDKKYSPTWHVVCGKSCQCSLAVRISFELIQGISELTVGSFVTHVGDALLLSV